VKGILSSQKKGREIGRKTDRNTTGTSTQTSRLFIKTERRQITKKGKSNRFI
jgi:hypothetical protein